MAGRVTSPDARNTTEWRKRGNEMAKITAIKRPRGEGLRMACNQSLTPAITLQKQTPWEANGGLRNLLWA